MTQTSVKECIHMTHVQWSGSYSPPRRVEVGVAWAPRPSPPGDTLFCVRSLPKPGAVFRLWGAVLQAGRCSPGFALLGSSYERGLLSVNVSLNAPPVEWKWCTVIFPPPLHHLAGLLFIRARPGCACACKNMTSLLIAHGSCAVQLRFILYINSPFLLFYYYIFYMNTLFISSFPSQAFSTPEFLVAEHGKCDSHIYGPSFGSKCSQFLSVCVCVCIGLVLVF